MPRVTPRLDSPLELRAVRRLIARRIGQLASCLEKLQWRIEERPTRRQVVAWQVTVFEPIRWWFEDDVDPPIDREAMANVQQVCRYLPEFAEVWIAFKEHPKYDERIQLQHISRQLNGELAEAYGLPAVHMREGCR